MDKNNVLRILHSMRGKIYNSIISEESPTTNIYWAYIDATGKNFNEISKDIPKIKYFIKPSVSHKEMDGIESLALVNDLIDLYQGYYAVSFKGRIKNIINYIKNSF